MLGCEKDLDSDVAADRIWFRLEISDCHLRMWMSYKDGNTEIDLSSDTCYFGTLIGLGTRWWFCFSFPGFFRHSVCASYCRFNSSNYSLTHVIHIYYWFSVLSSSLRCTAASLSGEKLSTPMSRWCTVVRLLLRLCRLLAWLLRQLPTSPS